MKLGKKLILFTQFCSVIPLLGLAGLTFYAAQSSLVEIVESNVESIAEQRLDDIQNHVLDAQERLTTWSNLSIMQDAANEELDDNLQYELDRLVELYPVFADLLVVNSSGFVIASTFSKIDKDNLAQYTEYKLPAPETEYQGPISYSSRLGKNIVAMNIPIHVKYNQFRANYDQSEKIGSLVGLLDWQLTEADLASRMVFGGEQDRQRFLVLTSTERTQSVLYSTKDTLLSNEFLSSLSKNVGVHEQKIDESNYVVASARTTSIKDKHDPQWALHVVLDTDVVYSSIHKLLKYILLTVAAAVLLILVFGSLLARAAVKPINALVVSAKGLASGDYDSKLPEYKHRDEIGELTQSFKSMRDAIKINEKELIERTEASEAASRLKGEFLANMSHEVRTPINGVLGMTELMMNTKLDETQSRYASTIFRSGQSLLAVINDILDFSKIEAGKLELQDSAFDLRVLIDDVVEMVAESAHKKNVEISAHLCPSAHVAYQGDANRVRQILINLLGNAIKFTSVGEVKLSVTSQDNDLGGTLLRFEVMDTGIGIPISAQSSIFESFVQADGSTTRKYGGSGLGLSISARLTELMKGDIGVRSEPNKGSTFWFTASVGKLAENVEDAWVNNQSLKDKRILIVDDNKTNRDILQAQVAHWGAEYCLTESGSEALQSLRAAAKENKPFDLAILDMHMPEMDGLALTVAIKDDQSIASTRLVLLSSMCDELDVESYRSIGLESILTKPVRQPELFQCLTAVLASDKIQVRPVKQVQTLSFAQLNGRILIAEDNPVNQELISEMMNLMGVNFDLVDNGQEAFDAFSKDQFDVLLMDCQMPVMDGFDATRTIREFEKTRNVSKRIPIIALTANALEGDRERCLECGMDEYLSKPVSAHDLHEMLSLWLELKNEGLSNNEAVQERADKTLVSVTSNSSSNTSTEKPVLTPVELLSPPLNPVVFTALMSISAQASPGFLTLLIAKFLDTSAGDIKTLAIKCKEEQVDEIIQLAHRLRSSSSNLGASHLAALCQILETTAGSSNLAGMDVQLENIKRERDRVVEALTVECHKAA